MRVTCLFKPKAKGKALFTSSPTLLYILIIILNFVLANYIDPASMSELCGAIVVGNQHMTEHGGVQPAAGPLITALLISSAQLIRFFKPDLFIFTKKL